MRRSKCCQAKIDEIWLDNYLYEYCVDCNMILDLIGEAIVLEDNDDV